VESYIGLLRRSGLSPIALEPESVAITRALLKDICSPSCPPTLIVDIGGDGTNLIIFSDGAVRLTSRAVTSDHLLTETLMAKLNKNREEAERIKLKVGLKQQEGKENEKIFNVLEPIVNELVNRIQEYVSFYHEHAGEESAVAGGISQIFLSGDGSLLAGLSEFLSQKLSLPVCLGDCLRNVSFCGDLRKIKNKLPQHPNCTTAFGLAIRNFKE